MKRPVGVVAVALGAVMALLGCRQKDETARRVPPINATIVRGEPVAPGALRQVVGLTYGGERRARCTGTLIDRDIVLTAAHCVCVQRPTNVFVGDNTASTEPSSRGLFYPIVETRAALHCGAEGSDTAVDIAVVRLKNPVLGVAPLSYAADEIVDRATAFRVVGFGATNEAGSDYDPQKQEAAVPALSTACDRAGDSQKYGCQIGQEIVAGQRRTPDTCTGDSGGPLLVSAKSDAGSPSAPGFSIAGVTSRSVAGAATACGDGGIYERLQPSIRIWLTAAIKSMHGGR